MFSHEPLINNVHIDRTLATTRTRRALLKTLVGTGAAVLAASTLGPALAHHTEQTYTVSSSANFRSGPGTGNSIISVIAKGSTFTITGLVQNSYAQINFNGMTGWVLASLVIETGSEQLPTIVASAWVNASVNLRSGPGTTYTVLRVISYGSQLGISNTIQNGFRHVSYAGQGGWVANAYISLYNPDSQANGYGTAIANVNLRAEPTTSSAILLVIPKRSPVQLLHTQTGDFLNATFNGKQGWAHKDYIRLD